MSSEATKRILLVEDNPDDAFFVQDSLGLHSGCELVHVQRWAEAEAELRSQAYDAMLLDLSLPDVDGLAVLERAIAAAPHVPIVVMTGLDDDECAARALEMGAQDYLVKGSYVENVLPRTIRYAIQRRRILEQLGETQKHQLELKDQFLSHVSHELRTPLTAIHQFVSLVLDGLAGDVTPQQQEYLAIAMRNADQLRNMISDLMDVTRAEAGKLSVEVRATDPGFVVWDTVRALTATAGENGVLLQAEISDDLPWVLADQSRVRQIVANLVENALKFTPSGGAVTVRVSPPDDDSDVLSISVQDTGCGIDAEGQAKIFDRLHQEEHAESESRNGLGLGLYICKELVSRQGGSLYVESEPGEGSTFGFTLPIFSLPSLLRPILVEHGRLRGCFSVIRVDVAQTDRTISSPLPESLLASVYQVVESSVLQDMDVVIPRMSTGDAEESFFVVAAADSAGMNALVRRIRRQLGQAEALKRPNIRLFVSGSVRECPGAGSADLDKHIDEIAASVEAMISDETIWRNSNG